MIGLLVTLIAVVVFLLLVIVIVRPRHHPPHHHPPHHHPYHIIGGCKGTRWGCCENGFTPKDNRRGTNCPKL